MGEKWGKKRGVGVSCDDKAAYSVVGGIVKSSLKKSVWEDEQKKETTVFALKKLRGRYTTMTTQP